MSPFARLIEAVGKKNALRLMQLYPPYVGAGVRVDDIADDVSAITVSMTLRPWNQNAFGTHFGGSLYSLCDPWFVLLLVAQLGPEYVCWDKSATIHFLRPGKGKVSARFDVAAVVDDIRAGVAAAGKINPVLVAFVKDDAGDVVCRVEKTLSIRKKGGAR